MQSWDEPSVSDETTRDRLPELRIGAPVHARDGRCGTLEKVVVDPHSRRVTHLVVAKGWLLKKHRVVPLHRVERVDNDGIHLDMTAADAEQLPEYHEESFIVPDPAWEPVAPYVPGDVLFWDGFYAGLAFPVVAAIKQMTDAGAPGEKVILQRGVDVIAGDAPVGTLDHVLIDPGTGRLAALVVKERRTDRYVIVPEDRIGALRANTIVLRTWNPDQPGVPTYTPRSDAELTAEVRAALKDNADLVHVHVEVRAGIAYLRGNVPTVEAKADADARARSVPGILGVDNALSADTALMARITASLADDPATALLPIEVIVDRGHVTLQGVVPTPEAKARAEGVAKETPGVVTVTNELDVRRTEADAPRIFWPGAVMQR